MLVSPAFAQAAQPAAGLGGFEAFLPLILIFLVFYFLLIRPQQKRQKQLKEMLSALRRGDKVLTAGGIIGTIVKIVSDTEVVVEIADNVKVRCMRATILEVITRTEPVAADTKDEPEGETK